MNVYIASDHGGFYLKEELKGYLSKKGYGVKDFGNEKFEGRDDYTDYVFPLALALAKDRLALGIVFGRSGIGEAVCANKIKGVYAAVCVNDRMAKRAREHNGANVLSMGAEYVTAELAKRMVDTFLKTPFSAATRHRRRVGKIKKYESSHLK
jgi:ribose 5-phosphate isomerase B